MSLPSALSSISYAAESSWGENVTTFGTRLAIVGAPVDASGLEQVKLDTQRVSQYAQGGEAHAVGFRGGSFKIKMWLCGHGSTTSGATSATALPTLLGYVIGGGPGSPPSGTTLTGGTATVPTTTASGTFTAGQLCRIGSNADTRGNGQFYAVSSHVTTTLTLLNAMAGSPTNGDVLYSAETIYTNELPSTADITGLRFLLQTANLQYECHGCWARNYTLSVPVNGELPSIEIEFGVSWWTYSSATFPSTTSPDNFTPAPAGGGGSSFFFNTKGTATRATRSVRSFGINVALNNIPIEGVGGVDQYQKVVGCKRGPATITVEWTEDAPATTTSPQVATDYTTTAHGLITWSNSAGSAMGAYFPKMVMVGNMPFQMNDGGINRLKYTYRALADETQTTNILASAMRIAFA